MVLCVKCNKKRLTNSPPNVRVICWEDYQMCAKCCIQYHPERYPLNIINQFLGKPEKVIKPDRYCLLCNATYFAKGYCKYHYFHKTRGWKEEKN